MSALDLDAIEARAAAATLGPWVAYRPAEYRHDYRIATTAPEMNRNREWYVGRLTRSHENEAHPSLHDAEFIAAARSDVPALVALARAQAAEIATLRAAYASDLAGLRAELRRADDERVAWRDLRDAARECLDALEAPAPVWDADESEHDGHAARLEVARVALRAIVGGERGA